MKSFRRKKEKLIGLLLEIEKKHKEQKQEEEVIKEAQKFGSKRKL